MSCVATCTNTCQQIEVAEDLTVANISREYVLMVSKRVGTGRQGYEKVEVRRKLLPSVIAFTKNESMTSYFPVFPQ